MTQLVIALGVVLLVAFVAAGIVVTPPRHVAVITGSSTRVVDGRTWRIPVLTDVRMVDRSPVDVMVEGAMASGVLTIEPDLDHLPPVPVTSLSGRAQWLLDSAAHVPDVAAEWSRGVDKLLEASGWRLVGAEARSTADPPGLGGVGAMAAIVDQVRLAIESGSAERALEDLTERAVAWIERAGAAGDEDRSV